MENKEIITLKKLLMNRASDKELKIFWIAVKTLKADRCSRERYDTAKKALYWLTRINNLRDAYMQYDSLCTAYGERKAKAINQEIDELTEKHLTKYAKKLGLMVKWNSWCHLAVKKGGSDVA